MIVVSLYFLRLPFALLRFYVQDVPSNFESSRLSSKDLNEKEQSFEASIPVQNHFSPLHDTNSEDQSLAFRQTSESPKSIPDSKTAEKFVLLM
jgi:hypothetical protein